MAKFVPVLLTRYSVKLIIYKLSHLNMYLLVEITKDDRTVKLLLYKGNSFDSSSAKKSLDFIRQNYKRRKL